jgi:hypothetical protein
MDFIKSHKWILMWSAAILILACVVKFTHLSKTMTQVSGLIELLLAIATGVAFGILATKRAD